MTLILHSGFGTEIEHLKRHLSDATFEELADPSAQAEQLSRAHLLIAGPHQMQPLHLAQDAGKKDPLLAVTLLPSEEKYDELRQALLFTPFLNKYTSCLHFDNDAYVQLQQAARQTKQRRKMARLKLHMQPPSAQRPANVDLQLDTLLNQAPVGAILLNKDTQVIAVNKFTRSLFRLQPLESPSALSRFFDRQATSQIERQLNNSATDAPFEVLSAGKYFEISVATVANSYGDPVDILLVTDITERKLEGQRIREVLDALPQMAWIADAQGQVTYLTEPWFVYTGQSRAEATGDGWSRCVHPEDRERHFQVWLHSLRAGRPIEQEARYRRSDGEYRWHLVRGIPILSPAGEVNYWVGTCTDIQEQKLIEEELSEKVRQSTEELRHSNELLRKSNQQLEQFAYIASHDLKEPLRKIRTFINLGASAPPEMLAGKYFPKIQSAAERMTQLIDDILEYSHLSGALTFQEADLSELLRGVLAELEHAIREKNAEVIAGPLPVIDCSPVQVSQVFANLIGNSLKYSSEHPVIRISARTVDGGSLPDVPLQSKKQYAELTFEDNGIGFDPQYASEIFGMFKRLHGKSEYGGSGIGLAMVQKVAENHQGFVKAEGVPGKGATFTLWLPMRQK